MANDVPKLNGAAPRSAARPAWAKPGLVKLGQIANVKGGGSSKSQGNHT